GAQRGVGVEEHGERDLAEKAGDAGDEDLAPAKGLLEIDAQGCSFAAIPGFDADPPPCSGSWRTPSCAASATSVMTMGGWCISVTSADRPCLPRAMSMASASVSARSQPISSGTCVFSVPTAMIWPRCWRPFSPQYHM